MKEELKDKYSAFIAEISEIMGLGKPIDILKLCATTDLFFQPLKKRIAELEKENAELKLKLEALEGQTPWKDIKDKSEVIEQLTKAKELLKEFVHHYKVKTIYVENMQDLLKQSEQFLNSEVEK